MKKLVVLAVVLAVVSYGVAFAAPASAAKTSATAKPAAAAKDMKVEVVGKVEVKDKVACILVAQAKSGYKVIAALKGKMLTVTGAKAADAEKLAGKDVVAKGTVKDGKIDLTSIAEKKAKAAAKPAAKSAAKPAAKPVEK